MHAGFGPPGTPGTIDQPHGHREWQGRLVPLDPGDSEADNPPALGPAGTVSITLEDWARFAQDQLDGVRGHGKLLRTETYRKLHTPVTGNYALGWGAALRPDGSPLVLAHTGSNGNWLADIRIQPADGLIELIATNAGNKAAQQALEEVQAALRTRVPARPR
jgi:CubicO group peptidase (beta-lactamase class C family)